MNDTAVGCQLVTVERHSADVVELEFEGRVADAGRKHRVYRAAHDRVEQRCADAAVHSAERVAEIGARGQGEAHGSLVDLAHLHAEEASDAGPVVDLRSHPAEKFEACHLRRIDGRGCLVTHCFIPSLCRSSYIT